MHWLLVHCNEYTAGHGTHLSLLVQVVPRAALISSAAAGAELALLRLNILRCGHSAHRAGRCSAHRLLLLAAAVLWLDVGCRLFRLLQAEQSDRSDSLKKPDAQCDDQVHCDGGRLSEGLVALAVYLARGPAGGDDDKGRLLWHVVGRCGGRCDRRRPHLTLHAEISPMGTSINSADRIS